MAISSLGRLESAPAARLLLTTGSTFVWSVAAARNGDAYLATDAPAKAYGLSQSTVSRIWRAFSLAPHRSGRTCNLL